MSEPAVVLSSSLDFVEAGVLLGSLRELIDVSSHVVVDASNVERVRTAGLQILLAAGATLRARRGHLEIRDPSQALLDAAQDLGLSELLGFGATSGEQLA